MSTYYVTQPGAGIGPGTYRSAVTQSNSNPPPEGQFNYIYLLINIDVGSNVTLRGVINYTVDTILVGEGGIQLTVNSYFRHVIESGNTVEFQYVDMLYEPGDNTLDVFTVSNNSSLIFTGTEITGSEYKEARRVSVTDGTLIFTNQKFTSNRSFVFGLSSNITFQNCKADIRPLLESNINANDCNVTFQNCEFITQSDINSVMVFGLDTNLVIDNTQFTSAGVTPSNTNGGCFRLSNSSAIINASSFTNYRSGMSGGALYLNNTTSAPQTCLITGTEFNNCQCNNLGSAIYANSPNNNLSLDITDSAFLNNGSYTSIGVLSIYQVNSNIINTNFNDNLGAPGSGQINLNGGTMNISLCNIKGGSGGLYIDNLAGATATIEYSLIAQNTIDNSTAALHVMSLNANVSVSNSAIGNNQGLGILNEGGSINLRNVTIANNENTIGTGGIINTTGTIDIANSIVAGNSNADVEGSFLSNGYNLVGIVSDSITRNGFSETGDISGTVDEPVDALLAPLGDNGGPTQTYGLLEGSPAIGAGNPDLIVGEFDQRGPPYPRSIEGSTDIGASENIILICFRGDSVVRTRNIASGEIMDVLAKDLYDGEYEVFDTNENKFVPTTCVFTTGVTNKYILIKKDLLGENMPSQDLYITEGHPIMINGIEVYCQNIPGSCKIEAEPDYIYSVCTDKRRPIMINNLSVMTWETEEWLQTAEKHKIKWRNNIRS